jgi:uncharacterized membrane protein YgdD (TMEM256/DUF423 family)
MTHLVGWRNLAVTAMLFGLAAVILAALGAHAIPFADSTATRLWDIALLIHLFHTASMLAIALLARSLCSGKISLFGLIMAFGTVLFSGSLYLRAAGIELLPGSLTPAGGFLLAASWLGLALVLVKNAGD